jgi:hypothetical protein
MKDTYTCPKCSSTRTYFVMPAGLNLRCIACSTTWAFRFILFVQNSLFNVGAL